MVVSSGPVTIRSVATAARAAAATGLSQLTSGIDLSGGSHIASPSAVGQAAPGSDPLAAPSGANMFFESDGVISLDGTVIEAKDGDPGLPNSQISAEFIEVVGGDGGGGGWVFIQTFGGGSIDIGTSRGLTRLEAGDGGPATATTTENRALARGTGATARSETGGASGTVNLDGIGAVPVGTDNSLIQRKVGIGGRGGNATATGADASRDAQPGSDAVAVAGNGGDAGKAQGRVVGLANVNGTDGGGGGNGGIMEAVAGEGGRNANSNSLETGPDGVATAGAGASGGDGGAGIPMLYPAELRAQTDRRLPLACARKLTGGAPKLNANGRA